jgi:hypothetical protein
MVTKVGRTNTMLICSDCGHPRAENPRRHRIRLERLATIAFLAALAGLAFAVSRMKTTPPSSEPARNTQADMRSVLKEDL